MLRRNLKPIFSVISLFVLLTAEECGCRNFENDPHRADYDLSVKMHKDTLFLDDGDYTEVTLDINAKSEVAEICDFYITEWSVNNDVQGELRSDDAKTTIDIKELKFKKGQTKLTYKPTKTGQHTLTFKVIDKWKDLEKEAKTNTITVKQKKDFECSGGSGTTFRTHGTDLYYPIDLKIGSMDKELKGSAFKISGCKYNDGSDVELFDEHFNPIIDWKVDANTGKKLYIKAPTDPSVVPPTITATISCDDKITKYVSIYLDGIYDATKTQKQLEKNLLLDSIRKYGRGLSTACKELRNDREVVMEAVKKDGDALEYASDELKDDKEIVLKAVDKNGLSLKHASERLRSDKETVFIAIQGNPSKGLESPLKYASDELKDDREFVLKASEEHSDSLCHASDRLRNDKQIVNHAIKNHGASFCCASDALRNNKEFALKFIKQDHNAFKYVSRDLQSDPEVVLEAVKKDKSLFQVHVPESLKSNKDLMLEMNKELADAWIYASEDLQNDLTFVLEALRQNEQSSRYIKDSKINSKRKIIVPILQQNGKDLEHVRQEFQMMKSVVMEAVKQNGEAFKYASQDLRSDREFVLEAIRQDGIALEGASTELRDDREIVIEAVRQNGKALEYASDVLKADQEIILEALKNNASVFKYAQDKLRGDTKFIPIAYQTLDTNKRSEFLKHYQDFHLVFPNMIRNELQKTALSFEGLTAPVINLDLECPEYTFERRFYVKKVKISGHTLSGLNIEFVLKTSDTIGDVARQAVIELKKEENLTEEVRQYLEEFPFIYLVFKEQSFSQKDEYRKLSELLV